MCEVYGPPFYISAIFAGLIGGLIASVLLIILFPKAADKLRIWYGRLKFRHYLFILLAIVVVEYLFQYLKPFYC